jgi:hemoglobin-like flavoprotein
VFNRVSLHVDLLRCQAFQTSFDVQFIFTQRSCRLLTRSVETLIGNTSGGTLGTMSRMRVYNLQNMKTQQVQLVKETWGYVIAKSDEAGELFYTRLFEVAPGVKHLFKGEMKEQSRKLMSMVTYVVTKLDKLDTIVDEIKSLAQRHNKYGAQPEHYAVVGQCLLFTLKTGLGARWNAETEEAWTAVYHVLADAMINGQKSAVSAAA